MYRYTGDAGDGTGDVRDTGDGTPAPADCAKSYKNHYVPVVQSAGQVRPRGVERQSRTGGVNASPPSSSAASAASASVAYPPAAVYHQPPQQQVGQRRSELATAVFTPSPVHRLSVGHVSHSLSTVRVLSDLKAVITDSTEKRSKIS